MFIKHSEGSLEKIKVVKAEDIPSWLEDDKVEQPSKEAPKTHIVSEETLDNLKVEE